MVQLFSLTHQFHALRCKEINGYDRKIYFIETDVEKLMVL